ncbi:TonB-dependent receptor [Hydrogenophaga crassostreae]|uniref:TonB-dependent receptor n=1 Tax=Hydrogenophaga crassostreae TaxID=1763535 RepID=A0A162SXP3_9BURK|nr:TonB-dependent siderophore receptor [Hydrogenophaga crassostreae]AOW14085.1 TonB-dependent receptor [Hydrogenophaga crassostreae]OAD43953.1 TonB-dependent receptor [Hydrogenophaga crassostreae]
MSTNKPAVPNRHLPPSSATPAHSPALLPLGAMLLATSMGALAQTAPQRSEATLPTVEVRAQSEPEEIKAKSNLRATKSGIGKGKQALRDIPQSVTVMTEMLINDRNLDDFREVLKTTAGVTFQAGETGEEDVRLRGFSLGQAGDIYVDGLRDAPLIERDTFNNDRIEVLKGSASMLFGKGSTGGVVNQVSKQPFLLDQHEVQLTVGTGNEKRLTGDFNILTGDGVALRINAMAHDADNHGASVSKKGIAPTYRWGIGLQDEFSVGFYHLETDGTPLYNHPWLLNDGVINPALPAKNYYGLSSDFLKTESTYGTFQHTHRFDRENELKTTIRHGSYERELLASAVRFESGTTAENLNPNTGITRGAKGRVGYSDLTQIQSDFSGKFSALGKQHELLAGIDLSREDADRNQRYTGETSASLPSTTVGTPNDGAVTPVPYGTPPLNTFETQNVGVYVQDTLHLNPQLRLIAGLRFDRFEASYRDVDGNSLDIAESLVSPRFGAIYQPNDTASYYASFGTSYNTSGDTYQFALGSFDEGSNNAKLANTPPEKSRTLELGGKFELFDDRATFGAAVFHTEKYNERNTDADSAAAQYLLSGKRHATGMEFNLSGRITPVWDIFYNHTWIPNAAIDESNVTSGNAQQVGDRPGLTPKHSASLWTTYRVAPMWRIGFGLNHRGSQNPEGNRNVTAPAFTTADAMVEYMVSESATLKLNVTNLSNKLYADSLYRGFYAPGADRSVQLSLKSTF